jgi:hypothetical protein
MDGWPSGLSFWEVRGSSPLWKADFKICQKKGQLAENLTDYLSENLTENRSENLFNFLQNCALYTGTDGISLFFKNLSLKIHQCKYLTLASYAFTRRIFKSLMVIVLFVVFNIIFNFVALQILPGMNLSKLSSLHTSYVIAFLSNIAAATHPVVLYVFRFVLL